MERSTSKMTEVKNLRLTPARCETTLKSDRAPKHPFNFAIGEAILLERSTSKMTRVKNLRLTSARCETTRGFDRARKHSFNFPIGEAILLEKATSKTVRKAPLLDAFAEGKKVTAIYEISSPSASQNSRKVAYRSRATKDSRGDGIVSFSGR